MMESRWDSQFVTFILATCLTHVTSPAFGCGSAAQGSSVVKFFFNCMVTPSGGWVENPIEAESVRGELALVYRSDHADPL
jgi:hypothetical protein